MRKTRVRTLLLGATALLALSASMPPASAIHWYRSTSGGCSAADGALTDDPAGTTPNVAATVALGHNAFAEGVSGFDPATFVAPNQTRIKAGESITWTWNSAHCHSVTSDGFSAPGVRAFDSGYHYPATPPESPQVVPGFLEYPVLDDTPTLSFTHTFTTPGTYTYACVHHAAIGMRGIVVVDAA